MALSFTAQLKAATREAHSLSDQLANSRLAFALSDESVWADALLVFYEVFKRLEEYKEELKMNHLEQLYVDKILFRKSAIEKDLNRYFGEGWKDTNIIRPEVNDYLQHLEELKDERPLLLLAYVYHLYMGLLSGGQIIKTKRQLKKMATLRLKSSSTFPEDSIDWVVEFSNYNIGELKRSIKEAMNNIAEQLTQEQRYALINESRIVFIYNNTIIKSIKGTNKVIFRKIFYALVFVKVALLIYFYIF